MSRQRTILALAIATLLCEAVLLLATADQVLLRTIAGIPFALLLPGSAAMLLVDPDGRLGISEWITISIGVSISAATLVGMALAATIGLTTSGALVGLTAVTFGTLVAAAATMAPGAGRAPLPKRRDIGWRVMLGALALLACGALALAFSLPDPVTARGEVVQLWGLADEARGGLQVGTANINAESREYRLTIEQGGRLISEQDVDLPAGSNHTFVIKPTALWTANEPVTAELIDKSGFGTPRTVSVWTTR